MLQFDFLDICCTICYWNNVSSKPCRDCKIRIKNHTIPINFVSAFRYDIWCRKCKHYNDNPDVCCGECVDDSYPDYALAPLYFEKSKEFDEWCKKCQYKRLFVQDEPCDKCRLEYNHIPTGFEERR